MAKKHTSKNVYDFCVAIDEAVHSVELELRAENLAVRNLHSSLENALAETRRNLSNERAETFVSATSSHCSRTR